jgi:preprotein translocase subunit SecF
LKFWPLIRLVPRATHFKFVELAPFAAVLSALLIIGSVASVAIQGMNFGIDFAGGTTMKIAAPGPSLPSDLRPTLDRLGVHDPVIQTLNKPNLAEVKFRSVAGQDPANAGRFVAQRLEQQFPGLRVSDENTVGPKVSGELLGKGVMALAIALGLMLIYIWFRFQLQFGLGAILALFHDIVLTVGLLSVMHIEVQMTSIAALLTVIGYSMNEKVISFDRLRENLRKFKTTPLRDVINLSENERLSRTLITGTTAMLALSGALFYPGNPLFSLVFTMAFGILIGTYSSIYVALPVILLWGAKRDDGEEKPIAPPPRRYG